jgi:hypothetical protein
MNGQIRVGDLYKAGMFDEIVYIVIEIYTTEIKISKFTIGGYDDIFLTKKELFKGRFVLNICDLCGGVL